MREPPKLSTALLKYLAAANDALAGDLREQYLSGRSRTWFWSQVAVAGLCGIGSVMQRKSHLVIAVFFLLVGVAPQGVTIDLAYPLVRARLDFDYQYVGLLIAMVVAFRWRWGRIIGRIATWALAAVVIADLLLTLVGMVSGAGSVSFSVLWPSLSGHSPVGFVAVGIFISGYLFWQSRALGRSSVASLAGDMQ